MISVVIFLLGLLVTAGLVIALAVPLAGLTRRVMLRVWPALVALVDGFGPVLGYLVTLAAWVGATLALCWGVGRGARAFAPEDHRMYRWWRHHHFHDLTRAMKVLTQMGDRHEIYALAVVAGVVLTLLSRRRHWVPALALVSVVGVEYVMQHMLALIIHRGHPPVGLGTYPSGGVARLLAVGGVVILLALRVRGRPPRWVDVVLWVLLGVLVWTELFSRIYLGKHWTSDAVGGAVFGLMLILGVGAAVSAALGPPEAERFVPREPLQSSGLSADPIMQGSVDSSGRVDSPAGHQAVEPL